MKGQKERQHTHSNGGHEVPCLPMLANTLYKDIHPITIQHYSINTLIRTVYMSLLIAILISQCTNDMKLK